ncbi:MULTISPECIES: hypothetical protein [Catenuloplanes]|uniref:hypothetical protein n=1 Tax=Catenuloplanes TaxID=33874 RepID=UPI0035B511FB
MVSVRAGLDHRQALLEAVDHERGEGGARRHAGDLLRGAKGVADADIVAGPGGVMTDEVGVVTGELTLRSELVDGHAVLRVQYKDAEEWYAVTGGKAALKDPADLDAVHAIAVGLLNRPEG